jgi:hypothetical protein
MINRTTWKHCPVTKKEEQQRMLLWISDFVSLRTCEQLVCSTCLQVFVMSYYCCFVTHVLVWVTQRKMESSQLQKQVWSIVDTVRATFQWINVSMQRCALNMCWSKARQSHVLHTKSGRSSCRWHATSSLELYNVGAHQGTQRVRELGSACKIKGVSAN